MPRDGIGGYNLPEAAFVFDTTIDEAAMNSNLSDIGTALAGSIAKNGETTPTADIKLGGFHLTGMAAGSAATDSANLGQVQAAAYLWGGTAGGTADALTVTMSPAMTAHAAGQPILFVAASNNTGAVTINPNAVGAKAITKEGTAALEADDLIAGRLYEVVYDGTQYQLKDSPLKAIVNADIDAAAAIATTKLGAGAIIQFQYKEVSSFGTTTVLIPLDDTIPQNTEGSVYLEADPFTPTDSTNKLIIMSSVLLSLSAVSGHMIAALFRDSVADALAVNANTQSIANTLTSVPVVHSYTPGSVSPVTFKVRAGSNSAGTVTFGGTSSARLFGTAPKAWILILEVAA